MRYEETGNFHKDFHLATDAPIRYVLETYGMDFLPELFRRTARKVYRDIHSRLTGGERRALVEHWRYFLEREGARFTITESKEETVLEVNECPAMRHLRERSAPRTTAFCLQTALLNRSWEEGTPFEISTVLTGEGTCRQIIRPRRNKEGHHASE